MRLNPTRDARGDARGDRERAEWRIIQLLMLNFFCRVEEEKFDARAANSNKTKESVPQRVLFISSWCDDFSLQCSGGIVVHTLWSHPRWFVPLYTHAFCRPSTWTANAYLEATSAEFSLR